MSRFLSPALSAVTPYTPGEQPQDQQYIKLNTNESPYLPSPRVVAAVSEAEVEKLRLYSDPACAQLLRTAAAHFGLQPSQVMPGNGSDENLFFALRAFCDETHPLAYADITYGCYSVWCGLMHIPSHIIPLKADFTLDPADYYGLNETIVIANPNAPTGLALPRSAIEEILKSNPNHVVIVDEAYVDFGGESCVPLIDNYENLLVVQTFSKSRQLAGARLGLAMGNAKLIADLNRVKFSLNPYNINRLTLKAGKAALDKRLVDNELWFRMGHWKNYQNPMMEGKPQPASGWLFNSIANKHADAMDNYPAPNVLPRAADDAQTAQVLSSILPVVLEQADYEQVYSDTWWRKLKQGTGVKGVFWDPEARGGVGEIAIRPMNLLMLYWEPGVADIQASPHFFSLSMENTKQLESRWPQLKGHSASVLDVPRFLHDGGLDTTEKSVVVDWYYKKPDEAGHTLLHYCKFCNGVVLYASENDPALAGRGFYDHGKYPFVFDPLFMEEDSPAGFGYIDVMKECQTAIDRMNHAMDENVLLASKQRYVLSDTAGVNEEELADLSRDIIHVAGRLGDESFRPLQTAGLQGNSLSYRNSRIEELKEISGNRDMTQGGTAGGVTAASAIAALQEAGSKLSRDMLKSAYRAFARECYLIIDLMRQFYDEERVFRVIGPAGGREFVPFSGAALRARPMGLMGGVELGSREPVFDIVVSAEKKSTFSRLSQNETAKECYQLGFFAPQNADAALAALEMMDFEGIEKVRQRVRQNGTLAQKLTAAQMQIARFNEKLSGAEENLSTRALAKNLSGALRQLS